MVTLTYPSSDDEAEEAGAGVAGRGGPPEEDGAASTSSTDAIASPGGTAAEPAPDAVTSTPSSAAITSPEGDTSANSLGGPSANSAGKDADERNDDDCAVCGDGGELICCDGCDKAYHGACINVKDASALPDPWQCPACDPTANENVEVPAKSPVKLEEDAEEEGEGEEEAGSGAARAKKRTQGKNEDVCYICYDGGLLVCCDHCDKAFHLHCHVPPLPDVPKGRWKCCECAASSYKKRYKCGQCEACRRKDCGKCRNCLDKPKFGGQLILKQVCIHRQCPYKRYAPPATVVTPLAQKMFHRRTCEDNDVESDALDEEEDREHPNDVGLDEDDRKPAAVAKMGSGRPSVAKAASIGCRKCKREVETGRKTRKEHDDFCPRKWSKRSTGGKKTGATEVAAAVVSPAAGQGGNGRPAAARGRNRAAILNGPGRDTNLRIQMELKRLRHENARQAEEIKRLKSAVKALTASLTG